MELLDLLKVIWRWKLLVIMLVGLTVGALFLQINNQEETYTAETILQVTTPDREDVSVMDDYAWTSDRDEITIAINNFMEVGTYDEVKRRTQEALNITEDYDFSVSAELGADLIYVSATARTPELAAEITNMHTIKAVEYFGELRSLPSRQALTHFTDQLALAGQDVRNAEEALLSFQSDNGIASLEDELNLQHLLLEQLEQAREDLILNSITTVANTAPTAADLDLQLLDLETQIQQQELERLRLERATLAAASATTTTDTTVETAEVTQLDEQILATENKINDLKIQRLELERAQVKNAQDTLSTESASTVDPLTYINDLIAQQRQKVTAVALLEPRYNLLQMDVERAREKYDLLASKYTETDLRLSFLNQAMFIQTIEAATPPTKAEDNSSKLLMMGGAGSLGLGLLLTFLFDYLFGGRTLALGRIFKRKPNNLGEGKRSPKMAVNDK